MARREPQAPSQLAVTDREDAPLIRAGGGVVRRPGTDGRWEYAVVHRPRYDDWSLPKGKVDPGETDEAAALREVKEETALSCRLGPELSSTRYIDRRGRPKVVRYWLMTPAGASENHDVFRPNDEIDEVRWYSAADAGKILTHAHDRQLISEAEDLP
jgi:8-oxo-dGTP diphosphatase